ncbi:hypothetical protein FRC14_003499 [Serendipita sp. 396]|nr:hypothetical protein FRC14_003499 [Serendipita sp. 396]KAG8799225.1 hypothetical protein FRC16_005517 [Serendipita sp. 398]KAG8867460.1 hypothetical protein FRC20_005713 [Serendipita sp. 405]KAG9043221.1 hypothetical protein FS842_001888 [Serendipita sp. 407]
MVMVKTAWNEVSPDTIKNCWNHTRIQRPRLPKITLQRPHPSMPENLAAGWAIVVQFAMAEWSFPEVHARLQQHLGDQYVAAEWNEPLDAVLNAENDTDAALEALETLRNKWAPSRSSEPHDVSIVQDNQSELEEKLEALVMELSDRRRIFGTPPTHNELLEPEEEREVGESPYVFGAGDADIVAVVQAEMAVARGNIKEIDSDDNDEEPEVPPPALKEMIEMCRVIEENSLRVCMEGVLEVTEALRRYRGFLQKLSMQGATQTTLHDFFRIQAN